MIVFSQRQSACQLHGNERTFLMRYDSSERCQFPTYAPQQTCHHSITSSVMASTPGGNVRPSALAVLRFSTSSNLVGLSIGNSDGFAPLKIFSDRKSVV